MLPLILLSIHLLLRAIGSYFKLTGTARVLFLSAEMVTIGLTLQGLQKLGGVPELYATLISVLASIAVYYPKFKGR